MFVYFVSILSISHVYSSIQDFTVLNTETTSLCRYENSGEANGNQGRRAGGGKGDTDDPDKRDEEFWEKDREMLEKHKQKNAQKKRKENEKVHNRKHDGPTFLL